MLKKITSAILIFASILLLLTSCSDKYPEMPSSEKENTVVMTLKYGDESYDVKYELYRAMLLSLKSDIDGGNPEIWTGEDAKSYIALANSLVKRRIAEIFSVFSIAKEIGIDVYSKDYDKMVKACIAAGVEGGSVGSVDYTGFGGDYQKYLDSLKEMNLNYSVQDLLLRYALATDDIYYYYEGNVENDATLGHLKYTRGDILEFYNSDDCVRVMQLFLSTSSTSYTRERAAEIRNEIAAGKNEAAFFSIMMKYSSVGDVGNELKNGKLIAHHNLDSLYYSELVNAAFALSVNATSPVIEINTGMIHGYFIITRIDKSDEHFDECYEYIEDVYVENEIGKIIDERTDILSENFVIEDGFKLIDFVNMNMDN